MQGLGGGEPGQPGRNSLIRSDGSAVTLQGSAKIEMDAGDVILIETPGGGGYGVPTPASTEALEMVARREGILLDPVYTAKAMAGLIARVRSGEFRESQTVLFWHTGGQPGYFA